MSVCDGTLQGTRGRGTPRPSVSVTPGPVGTEGFRSSYAVASVDPRGGAGDRPRPVCPGDHAGRGVQELYRCDSRRQTRTEVEVGGVHRGSRRPPTHPPPWCVDGVPEVEGLKTEHPPRQERFHVTLVEDYPPSTTVGVMGTRTGGRDSRGLGGTLF